MTSVYHLRGLRSSILVIPTSTLPELIYWGAALSQTPSVDELDAMERPVPEATLDADVPLTLCPESSQGWFSAPGVEGAHDGVNWAPQFQQCKIEAAPSRLLIRARDLRAGLELIIDLRLDPETDVLTKSIQILNRASCDYQLQRLALTLPLPSGCVDVLGFHGRWVQEFQSHRQRLNHGTLVQENRRGRTSHQYFPGMISGTSGFSESQGDVFGCHLGWSGNHRFTIGVETDGRRWLQAEELLLPGEVILKTGEIYQTPILYGTYAGNGLNQLSAQFQQYVREHILNWPDRRRERPVHLNIWEGVYFDHEPSYINQMVREAAKLGVERFIVDDGWFRGRNHDKAGLGDWYLDTGKYANGLEEVIAEVHRQGMSFGLWFEPEMVNPDSDLYRKHPDWVLGQHGYVQQTGRYQYVLDLQNPAVYDYLLERLSFFLGQYPIDYIKWDMNRELVQPSHRGRGAVHGQTRAVYRLLDALRLEFPTVEIESCASGGGRMDYEVLKRTHRFWLSDCNDALERQTMQRNASLFFPPEVLGSHIGAAVSHTTRRQHSLAFRALTAMAGHFGIELDPVRLHEQERVGISRYVELYKRFRSLMHRGRWRQLPHADLYAYGVQSEDQGLYWVCQLTMARYSRPGRLCWLGLESQRYYRLNVVDQPELKYVMKKQPGWMQQNPILSGECLMKLGLEMPVMDPETALLLHLEMVN